MGLFKNKNTSQVNNTDNDLDQQIMFEPNDLYKFEFVELTEDLLQKYKDELFQLYSKLLNTYQSTNINDKLCCDQAASSVWFVVSVIIPQYSDHYSKLVGNKVSKFSTCQKEIIDDLMELTELGLIEMLYIKNSMLKFINLHTILNGKI